MGLPPMSSALDQLAGFTTIVADTGDIEAIRRFKPTDATTNPTLILAASQMPQYSHFLKDAVEEAKKTADKSATKAQIVEDALDRVIVKFGVEILKIVPGKVSTELDARLSFDTAKSVEKGRKIAALYKEHGIDVSERVLIKIASTWEGIEAGKQLETENIHCNLTLLFSFCQAVACAQAKITLISPFVGRIMDWHKKAQGVSGFAPAQDPGVVSVTTIYNYFKRFGHKTVVMGASFRNIDEIVELAGCDKLTIGPKLLEELQASTAVVPLKLDANKAKSLELTEVVVDEKSFRWMLNDDAMATEKLAEGIRNFASDIVKLEKLVNDLIDASHSA
eukprot:c2942_g1_i1.p1 GENE.c2942_g1_i1~~c2942_g1_i1.p1  ORF type:complete len:335 (-),score=123.43 c2942_g1_i1:181-1185(-)